MTQLTAFDFCAIFHSRVFHYGFSMAMPKVNIPLTRNLSSISHLFKPRNRWSLYLISHVQFISQHSPGIRLTFSEGLMHPRGTGGGPGHCLSWRKPFLHSMTTAHDASVSFSPCDNFRPSYLQLLSVEGKIWL